MIGSARIAITAGIAVALAGGGWLARGWYEDAQRLTAERAARQAIEAAQARESTIAEQVEQRLAQQRVSERIIDRGIVREIEKPIYRRVCLGDDAIRLLNSAAANRAPAADAASAVPGNATGVD